MYLSQKDLKNGSVNVERRKPILGTIALSHGFSTWIAFKYNPTARYVKMARRTRLV